MVFPTVLITALKFATLGLSARSEEPDASNTHTKDILHTVRSAQEMISGAANSTDLPFDGEQYEGPAIAFGDKPVVLEPSQALSSAMVSPPSLGESAYNGTWSANISAFGDAGCNPPLYNAAPVPLMPLPSPNQALATVYRYRQQQGVNLGSWFMLEGWMVPSLFMCAAAPAVSEYDVATGWGGQAKQVLEKHWDTFITESDFAWMAALGINTVRLPLGYWHIGTGEQDWISGTLYEGVRSNYIGAWPRVLRAVSLAEKYGIGVLIDLHGAPGSQNGQQHSGVSDGQTNLFSSPSNMQKTISVLQFLTKTFVNVPNIVGIQLLNEPVNIPEVFDFYTDALNTLRSSDPAAQSFPFYLHDAFDLDSGANFVRSRGREWNILDHHSYYVFTPYDNSESATSHTTDLSLAGSMGSALMAAGMGLNGNLIVGEWSCALSDQSLSVEENPISARRQFCEVQEQTYRDVGGGAAFWSLTKENCEQDPAWCFKSAVGNALPTSFFSYEGLLVAKNLTDIVVAGATSHEALHEAPRGSEGGEPRSNSSGVRPATWATVTSKLYSDSPQWTAIAASVHSSDVWSVAGASTSDAVTASTTPTMLDVLTTLSSETSPSATVAESPPGSATLTTSDMPADPTTFQPMRRRRSGNNDGFQLSPLAEVLARTGRPDAVLPAGMINTAAMSLATSNAADCRNHSCGPQHATTSLSRATGVRRRWSAREHRGILIHRRRKANADKHRRRNDESNVESGVIAPDSLPTPEDTDSEPETGTILPETAISSHNPTTPVSQILEVGAAPPTSEALQLTPAQQAIQRGFSDGFMTAKMFAQQGPGMSRLGFKWQYVEDSLAAHGSNVAPGKEGYYREWFEKGLLQGEAMVAQVIARMNA